MLMQGETRLVELMMLAAQLDPIDRLQAVREIVRLAWSSGKIEAISEIEKRIDESLTGLVK